MDGSSKGDEERGFAALFNEFVAKVQYSPSSSPEVEKTNSDPEDDKKMETKVEKKDEKDPIDGENSWSKKDPIEGERGRRKKDPIEGESGSKKDPVEGESRGSKKDPIEGESRGSKKDPIEGESSGSKKDPVEGESRGSKKTSELPISEGGPDKKMESCKHDKAETLGVDNLQIHSKQSSTMESVASEPAADCEENVNENCSVEKGKHPSCHSSSQDSSPHSVHHGSSPVPSNGDSSYQTSPASSTASSSTNTPSSSTTPITLQSRSAVLSAASTKLSSSSSSARKLPPKVEKPVLRDRAGKKRYNSLESEFVVNIDVKRERSRSVSVGQSSRRRSSKGEKEGPRYRNQRGKPVAKPEERKRPQEKVLRPGLEFIVGFKLEAMDFCQNKWYPAKIVHVDEEEQQVLIHFEKWNSRYDEWIDCESERLRPLVRQSTRKEAVPQQHPTGEYKYGEEVLARWSDCRYYPAKVLNTNKNGTYRMLFYDGIEKNVLATNMRVMPDELKAQNFFSNFTLPPAPPAKGKKRWFAKEESVSSAASEQPENTAEPTMPATTTKRRLSRPVSPLSPPSAPPKKVKLEEKVKSPKEEKTVKTKVASSSPANEVKPPERQATPEAGSLIVVDPKPVLKPVLSSAKMEELISRNIKEPLLNDKDLGLLRDRRKKILAPKELVIDLDHNKYKCDVKGCDKSFRKSTLLEYHKKYYHATKTSTSSAASRVLHRTRKRISGSGSSGFRKTRSDARSKRKRIRQKRLSAPAKLVSSYPTRRTDRGAVRKRVTSPGVVPEDAVPTSPLGDRRSSRIRHYSAPLESQVTGTRMKSNLPENTVKSPKVEDQAELVEPSSTAKFPASPAEVAVAKKPKVVAPEKDQMEVEVKTPPVAARLDPSHQYAKKVDETTSIVKHELDSSRVQAGEMVRGEEQPLVREMKNIMRDVSMLEEEIRKEKEEERHRHRKKHKKNKDRKRRKKKKKDKDKKRRTKGKERTGLEGSDEETETEEEDDQRKEEKRKDGRILPLNDDAPSSVLFKEPSLEAGVRQRQTSALRSSVGVDDDVVKCICKNTQEEGFMIQCEVCNCWQHSKCVGLSNKSVPQTYACFYCHVSKGGMPPLYDSEVYEWYESGNLPRFPDFGKDRAQEDKAAKLFRLTTNSLMADLLMLAEVLQGLQHKISILQNPDHPEAKLWAKDWILRSRGKAASKMADSWTSNDLASTLKEMFSLGKLRHQGDGIHLGEGSESGALGSRGEGPDPWERGEDSGLDDHFEKDPSQDSVDTTGQIPIAGSTVEVVSSGGDDSVPDGEKGGEVTESAKDGESSSFIDETRAGTSGFGRGQSTASDVAVESASSKDHGDGAEMEGTLETPTTVTQSEPPSDSTSLEPLGVNSKVDNSVSARTELDGAGGVVVTGTRTKQVKEGQSGNSRIDSSGEKNDGTRGMDHKEPKSSIVSPSSVDIVDGKIDSSTHSSGPSESSRQNKGPSSTSKSLQVTSGGQDDQKVSSDITHSSVSQKELASTEQNTGASDSKDIDVVTNKDKAISQTKVSITEESPVTKNSETGVEVPLGQNTKLTNTAQSSQPVGSGGAPNANITEPQLSGQFPMSRTSGPRDVTTDDSVVKSNDSGELVAGSEGSVEVVTTQTESSGVESGEGKEVLLNVEDSATLQMTCDKPGPSRVREDDVKGEERSSEGAAPQETERMEDEEAMDVDDPQGMDAESSMESVTKPAGESLGGEEEGLENVSVELSQAYLLRHINTLHDQLSERMNLIEMEVEKLEKMFSSSPFEWQAITQDPTVMKKKLRVLLGDLHKINTIVSL